VSATDFLTSYHELVREERRAREELAHRFRIEFGKPHLDPLDEQRCLEEMMRIWRLTKNVNAALQIGINKGFEITDAQLKAVSKIDYFPGARTPHVSPTAPSTAHHHSGVGGAFSIRGRRN